jgi:hypothetical protein
MLGEGQEQTQHQRQHRQLNTIVHDRVQGKEEHLYKVLLVAEK